MSANDDPEYADERIEELCGEVLQLRADLATAQATVAQQAAQIEAMELERGELILARDYARDQVDEQGEALEQAREAIDDALDTMDMEGVGHGNAGNLCRAWLAAHPAPARDEATAAPISAAEQDMIDSWHDRL